MTGRFGKIMRPMVVPSSSAVVISARPEPTAGTHRARTDEFGPSPGPHERQTGRDSTESGEADVTQDDRRATRQIGPARAASRTSRRWRNTYRRELLGALLPHDRVGPRGRGPRPGDLPARVEGLPRLRGPLVGAHLALPHRHQRLPHQPRGPHRAGRCPPVSAPPTARPATRSSSTTRCRGSSRSPTPRSWCRARLDPAGVHRRPPAPAGPAAGGADPARRAPLVGQGGRRGARDHHRRGQLRAAAGPRPDGAGARLPRTPSSPS